MASSPSTITNDPPTDTPPTPTQTIDQIANNWSSLRTQVTQLVTTLFTLANRPPPTNPDIARWTLLCYALSHKVPLASVLPPDIVSMTGYDDPSPAVQASPPLFQPLRHETTDPDDISAIMTRMLTGTRHSVDNLGRSNCVARLAHYEHRVAEVAAARWWLDEEVVPIVVARRDGAFRPEEDILGRPMGAALAGLHLKSLRFRLWEMEREYSRAAGDARRQVEETGRESRKRRR
ncbi:hypothetical protein CONLIGDRAFT_692368 [Coniochaeta ligniaria NRRL 30616]|uniref:Uncharacterized protein n=1 Tax=Coniochaeta ligniaria NRRL 30616 TaxID=1408157 RepID=A0A1J7I916_9PEZI|nr:hypothetical protein CONLIGDRAFT_692368 [Coniochaeta ligniaria NRRL 30616]